MPLHHHSFKSNLLDISQIEGGRNLHLDKRPTPIRKLLTNVLDNFKQHSPKHQFSLQFKEEVPEILTIDAGRIVQILENLLSNAVKYSSASGPIELLATVKGEQLKLVVLDHGLGMSIVREIVEAHGGEIRVESTPKNGTSVTLLIPFADAPLLEIGNRVE